MKTALTASVIIFVLIIVTLQITMVIGNFESINILEYRFTKVQETQSQLIERAQLTSAVEQMGFALQSEQMQNHKMAMALTEAFQENEMLREQIQRAAEMVRALIVENNELRNSHKST